MSYFADVEFWCQCGRPRPPCDAPTVVVLPLLEALNRVREIVNRPIVITSGLRCAWWNAHEGGRPDSGHLDGTEADLACATSRERWELLQAIYRSNLITRIGIGKTFLHVGVSPRLDSNVVWLYT